MLPVTQNPERTNENRAHKCTEQEPKQEHKNNGTNNRNDRGIDLQLLAEQREEQSRMQIERNARTQSATSCMQLPIVMSTKIEI